MRIQAALLCGLALCWGLQAEEGKVVMCYFESWSVYRWGEGTFDVEDIPSSLCTHLVYGFAGVDNVTHTIRVDDPYNDLTENWGRGAFRRFTGLKQTNPDLKTLLAVGGWNEGSKVFSDMAVTAETRAIFISSAVYLLQKEGFDGLDLDWEYPGGREDSPGREEDRANFALLAGELRAVFTPLGLLLTAAVGAGEETIDVSYDVSSLAASLDFINLMTYDYHGWWDGHPFTGHHAPLFPYPGSDEDTEHPAHHRSIQWTVEKFLELGARPGQLLLGLPAYGRGFTLASPDSAGQFAPAVNGIPAAPYTQELGYWGYNEICSAVLAPEVAQDWTVVREEATVAPYAVSGDLWIGYDDEQSIQEKVAWARGLGLGGVMFWSVDTDDFHGQCGEKFALIKAAKAELWDGKPPTTGAPPTEPPTTTRPEPTGPAPVHPPCTGPGLLPDPANCAGYFTCLPDGAGGWVPSPTACPPPLLFDPTIGACNWPDLVDCQDDTTA